MSVSQAITPHTPYLRRFSRALTGSQSGGDAYVFATLEAIVTDPNSFAAAGDAITLRPRIAFLLSTLEEFATAAVADTLECSIEEAAFLIDAAGREIAKQIRTDVLIIEDEPLIALDL
jgi:DNA-directed RNA polymerase specialized sigma24 family protein